MWKLSGVLKKRVIGGFIFGILVIPFCAEAAPQPSGDAVDIIVNAFADKLVEKKVFTQKDADEVRTEIKNRLKDLSDKIAAHQAESDERIINLPKWVKNTKLEGDIRLRYQVDKRKTDEKERNRARLRYRLGFETKLTDTVKVGAGLTSGGGNPRSANQTLDNSFETPDIRLDYAFVEWQALKWAALSGGKVKNPVWRTSGLLWDSDIRPAGVASKMEWKEILPDVDGFFNSGLFFMEEEASSGRDPLMWFFQPGIKWYPSDNIDVKIAGVYYGFHHEKGSVFDYSSGTNTMVNGGLKYNYDSLGYSAEIGYKDLFEYVKYCGVFSDYICNLEANDENQGVLIGGKIGDKKVSKRGNWQVKGAYRYLQRDAWLDTLPNADVYGGDTDIWGSDIQLMYAIIDNIVVGVHYYYAESLEGSSNAENMIQTDLMLKF